MFWGILMTTVTISLPDSLREFIDRQVETKGYGNVSEYVRGLLRDAQKKEADARLESLLLEGLASGRDRPNNREFWREIKAEATQIMARKKQMRKRGLADEGFDCGGGNPVANPILSQKRERMGPPATWSTT